MIRIFPISIEKTPRDYMVYIWHSICLVCCYSTMLTRPSVSDPGSPTLFAPIWAAPFFVSTKPSGAVFSRHVSRFFLPIQSTFHIAKNMFIHMTRDTKNLFAAIGTITLNAFYVLSMIWPTGWGCFFSVLLIAFFGTESLVKFFRPAFVSFCSYPALGAYFANPCIHCYVTTIRRTQSLFWMVSWGEK